MHRQTSRRKDHKRRCSNVECPNQPPEEFAILPQSSALSDQYINDPGLVDDPFDMVVRILLVYTLFTYTDFTLRNLARMMQMQTSLVMNLVQTCLVQITTSRNSVLHYTRSL